MEQVGPENVERAWKNRQHDGMAVSVVAAPLEPQSGVRTRRLAGGSDSLR